MRNGKVYRYLCECHWIDGKPRQKVVAYLGAHKTVKAAYAHWQRESKKKGRKTYASKMMKKLQPYLSTI
jgi:hypothetical protein